MNGFTSKEVCGEQCSKAEPLCQKVFSEDNMSSAENAYESSTLPTEKMTETVVLPEEEQNGSVLCAGSSNTADKDSVNGAHREVEGDRADEDTQEEDKNDDTGQGRENNDVPFSSNATMQAEKINDEPLTRERIKELLGQNIEFFFSRENWSSDPYLLSQMDSDQYVPVYILANCSQFKSLTKDHSIIMEALKDSLFVQLDEEKNRVRPNYKRCIVILREIPKSTPVKEIEAMFEGEGCPKVVSCEFVHNDFWYVTFESDSDAQKAYRYLRETVKTFMDKPILARIKTKPMSRIGCLSVLPSYSGKAPVGESRDGALASQAAGNVNPGVNAPGVPPAGPGIQGIPSPHPPPNAYQNNSQRMFYTQQSSINPPFHNYNFTGSTLPTAYFYPNPLMQWTSPNFYDINSFIQYNGLSPRAAFKPPTNARFSNNGNSARRNKNRDPKFDKNETRHLSSGSNGSGVGGSQQQLRHTQPNSRPQSAQSPHLCNQAVPHNSNLHHSLPNNQTAGQLSHISKGESHSNISNTINSINNNNSNLVQTNHNSFAQNDLSLASQSNLYTSFSPPAGMSIPRGGHTVKVEKTEKGELSSHGILDSTEASNIEDNSSEISEAVVSLADSVNTTLASPTSIISTTLSQNYNHSNSLVSNSIISSQVPPQSSIGSQQMHSHHHHHHYHQSMPASHRSAFNNESHPGRDSQPQRQITRGGRRRVSRRDDEINGHPGSGNGRGSQRGAAQNNGDLQSKCVEVEKPFELQATSFPPLPTADEIAASTHEDKATESTSQLSWSGETHKFSDVMKGTAKPKHFPSPSITTTTSTTTATVTASTTTTTTIAITEKEIVAESLSSLENNSSIIDLNGKLSEGIVLSTNPESNTVENTNHNINNNNNNTIHTSCSASDNGTNSSASTSISNTTAAATTTTTTTTTTSLKNSSEGSSIGNSSVGRPDRPAAPREERRNVGMQVIRREREFIAGIGRGGPRRERDVGNFRMSGNKENRPQTGSSRSWREDRVDPDGWITKGPRDTRAHRDHRYNHQHNFYESRNFSNSKTQTIVNGDASPPPPPKPEVSPKSVENNLPKTTTTTATTTPTPNSVKHFTKPETKSLKSEVADKEKQTTSSDGEHKTSWAKMALASKDQMERLSAELKEKEEQERQKKRTTKPPSKTSDRLNMGREGKQFRRENFSPREREKEFAEKGREFKGGAGAGAGGGGPDRNAPFGFKPREALRPKSPK